MNRDFRNNTTLADLEARAVTLDPRFTKDETPVRYYVACFGVLCRDQDGVTELVEVEIVPSVLVDGGTLLIRSNGRTKPVTAGTLTRAQSRDPDKIKAAVARVLGLIDATTFDAAKAATVIL